MYSNDSLELTLGVIHSTSAYPVEEDDDSDMMELDVYPAALLAVRNQKSIHNSDDMYIRSIDSAPAPSGCVVLCVDTNIFIRDLNLVSSFALL
jgi:hypothetical protein